MRRRYLLAAVALPLLVAAGWVGVSYALTERDIAAHADSVRQIADQTRALQADPVALATLPVPVQRYFNFAFPEGVPEYRLVTLAAEGDFRRPQTQDFAPTTASQTIATTTPALLFAATTPVGPGLWARAYDYFAKGEMEMRAKIASTITVVDEEATEALNRTSLRRWLLESPLYPMALLPGGPVRWEAIDDTHARAIVTGFGLEAAMVATFRNDGSLESFMAEEDGDLTTPYHGSGEYAARDDYQLVQGMMIPHSFEIARAAKGEIHPFWKGHITQTGFD